MDPSPDEPARTPFNPGQGNSVLPTSPVSGPPADPQATFGQATVITPQSQPENIIQPHAASPVSPPTDVFVPPPISASPPVVSSPPPATEPISPAPAPSFTNPPNSPIPPVDGFVALPPLASEPPVQASSTAPAFAATPPSPPSGSKKKKLILGGVAALIILLGAAGYVFAIYLPNQPQNVFKTGLNRSGKALDELVNKTTDSKTLNNFKKSDITASAKGNLDGVTYSSDLSVKFDSTKSNGSLNVTSRSDGDPSQVLNAKFMSEVTGNNRFPDIYLQLSGLKSFGLDEFVPQIDQYDGKWIVIDSDYLKSIGLTPDDTDNTLKISSADITQLVRDTMAVSRDYVFTTDSTRAVFENKKYINKETVDGVSAYHYQVGINKQHGKDFCRALIDKLASTDAYKHLLGAGDNASSSKDSDIKDCQSMFDDVKDTDTFDMWIDSKYKLIHKIRIYDSSSSKTYTEVGQNYKGGDDISLFVNLHDQESKADGSFTLTTNLKSYETKLAGNIHDSSGSYLDLNLTAKPLNGEVDVQKPANPIKIEDVIKSLGLDVIPAGDTPSSASKLDSF